jgi:hypothetical protein
MEKRNNNDQIALSSLLFVFSGSVVVSTGWDLGYNLITLHVNTATPDRQRKPTFLVPVGTFDQSKQCAIPET